MSSTAIDMPSWPVIGHERAITVLRRSLAAGRPGHAYLFTGPEGVGKRTLAISFAMALNCESPAPAGQVLPDVPCGLCGACSRIKRGTHPDVSEISLRNQTGQQEATPTR